MSRKSVGLALVLTGGLLAWTPPAAYAQTAPGCLRPFVRAPLLYCSVFPHELLQGRIGYPLQLPEIRIFLKV